MNLCCKYWSWALIVHLFVPRVNLAFITLMEWGVFTHQQWMAQATDFQSGLAEPPSTPQWEWVMMICKWNKTLNLRGMCLILLLCLGRQRQTMGKTHLSAVPDKPMISKNYFVSSFCAAPFSSQARGSRGEFHSSNKRLNRCQTGAWCSTCFLYPSSVL